MLIEKMILAIEIAETVRIIHPAIWRGDVISRIPSRIDFRLVRLNIVIRFFDGEPWSFSGSIYRLRNIHRNKISSTENH